MAQIQELVTTFQKLSSSEQKSLLITLQRAYQTNAQPERLTDLRLRYPGEWIAVIIPAGEDRYAPERGYLLAHSRKRATVWQEIEAHAADKDIFVFFTGPAATKGFEITFHDTPDSLEVATLIK